MDNLTKIILIVVILGIVLGCSCSCKGVESFGRRAKKGRRRGRPRGRRRGRRKRRGAGIFREDYTSGGSKEEGARRG